MPASVAAETKSSSCFEADMISSITEIKPSFVIGLTRYSVKYGAFFCATSAVSCFAVMMTTGIDFN